MGFVLLIEPVWNRNQTAAPVVQTAAAPFNRTSLESKHAWEEPCRDFRELLIEPVWNRNDNVFLNLNPELALLIEPVWNRNGPVASARTGAVISPFNRTSLESKLFTLDA